MLDNMLSIHSSHFIIVIKYSFPVLYAVLMYDMKNTELKATSFILYTSYHALKLYKAQKVVFYPYIKSVYYGTWNTVSKS